MTLMVQLPSAAAKRDDWFLIHITTGNSGASGVVVTYEVGASGESSEPVLVGRGFGSDDRGVIFVNPVGGGSPNISSAEAASHVEVEVVSPHSIAMNGRTTWNSMSPRTTEHFLVFVTGVDFDAVDISDATADSGSVITQVTRGRGSRAISAIDGTGTGTGVGPVTAGDGLVKRRVGRGIAGGWIPFEHCVGRCEMSWKAPREQTVTGEWDSLVVVGGGSWISFAGRKGIWRWRWSGLGFTRANPTYGPPIPALRAAVGAYAPVGSLWRSFD